MRKEFTKYDLKTGMWVKLRGYKNKYIVLCDCETNCYGRQDFILIDPVSEVFTTALGYADNLCEESYTHNNFDIMEVYWGSGVDGRTLIPDHSALIWKREEPKHEATQTPKLQNNFNKYDRILVRADESSKWAVKVFSHTQGKGNGLIYVMTDGKKYAQAVTFEGNEGLIGKCESPCKDKKDDKSSCIPNFNVGDKVRTVGVVSMCDGTVRLNNGWRVNFRDI